MVMSRDRYNTVKRGFSKKAEIYDYLTEVNPIIQLNREVIRNQVLKYAKPNETLLEMNAGTGEDAEFFCNKGLITHATDISPGMLAKIKDRNHANLTFEEINNEQIKNVQNAPYNHILSNLGGLNMTKNISNVTDGVTDIILPGGYLHWVIFSKFSLWELTNVLWDRKIASRRFHTWFSSNGIRSRVGGVISDVYYHSAAKIKQQLSKDFDCVGEIGISAFIPPSYFESFPQRLKRAFRLLNSVEVRLGPYYPFNKIGDFILLSFQRKL